MGRASVGNAVWGGLLGTVAITALMYGAPVMGLPRMDIATLLGTMFAPPGQTAFWIGLAAHFMIGTLILPLLYVYGFARWLGTGVGGGLWYGLAVWAFAAAVFMPMAGAIHPLVRNGMMPGPGFFMLGMGALAPVGSLMGHLIYGAVLGSTAVTGSMGAAEPAMVRVTSSKR